MLLSFDIENGNEVLILVFAAVLVPFTVKLCEAELVAIVWFPKDKLAVDAVKVGVAVPPPEVKDKLKLSIPVEGRFPAPVVFVMVTILIQTVFALLSKAVPKSTLTVLLENEVFPVVTVPVVVAAVKVVGTTPKP